VDRGARRSPAIDRRNLRTRSHRAARPDLRTASCAERPSEKFDGLTSVRCPSRSPGIDQDARLYHRHGRDARAGDRRQQRDLQPRQRGAAAAAGLSATGAVDPDLRGDSRGRHSSVWCVAARLRRPGRLPAIVRGDRRISYPRARVVGRGRARTDRRWPADICRVSASRNQRGRGSNLVAIRRSGSVRRRDQPRALAATLRLACGCGRATDARPAAIHDCRHHAGLVSVSQTRPAVERRACRDLGPARFQSIRASGARHVLQPHGRRPLARWRERRAGDGRYGGVGVAHSRQLSSDVAKQSVLAGAHCGAVRR
jgi:hypothetical protein